MGESKNIVAFYRCNAKLEVLLSEPNPFLMALRDVESIATLSSGELSTGDLDSNSNDNNDCYDFEHFNVSVGSTNNVIVLSPAGLASQDGELLGLVRSLAQRLEVIAGQGKCTEFISFTL